MKIINAQAFFDKNGIRGKDVKSYRKTLKETPGIYRDYAGTDPEMLMYTVYSYGPGSFWDKKTLHGSERNFPSALISLIQWTVRI